MTSWLILDSVGSTQDTAADLVREGRFDTAIVFSHDQTAGKGRFGRLWESIRGYSLTMSIIFWDYADWPRPWLIGMAVAVAVAETIDCELRWPNDVAFKGKKTGGILTELISDSRGRQVAAVGVGVNLLQQQFPDNLPFATSVFLATGESWDSLDLAREIVSSIARTPPPASWDELAPLWIARDATPGKRYRLADGREATALKVGHEGALLCEVDGEEMEVVAAEALFGS